MARVERTVHLTARIPEEMRDQLEAVAKAGDRTVSAELRRALKSWLSHHSERLAA